MTAGRRRGTAAALRSEQHTSRIRVQFASPLMYELIILR